MSLTKGFLHAKVQFDKFSGQTLGLLILAGLLHAYFLYAFAVVVREVARVFTAHMGLQEYLHLSGEKEFFYNFWLAALSLVVGFATISRPLLLQTIARGSGSQRLTIANEQQSLPFFTLYLVGKMMILYGVWVWTIPVFLYVDFYEFKYVFLLLVLVVFGSQWLSINRVFKRAGLRMMFVTFVIMFLCALLFALKPPLRMSTLDRAILRQYPGTHFQVDLPQTPSEFLYRDGYGPELAIRLGIGFPVNGTGVPITYVHEFPFDSAASWDIEGYLIQRKASVHEYEQNRIAVRLFIDQNVPMKKVNELRSLLYRMEIRQLYFAVMSPDSVSLFMHNIFFKPLYRPGCDAYFRMALHNDSTNNDGFYPLFCDEIGDLTTNEAWALVVAKRDELYFNGSLIDDSVLYNSVLSFFEQNADGVLQVVVHEEIEFGRYLALSNAIIKADHDNRDPFFFKNYGFTYREGIKERDINYWDEKYSNALKDYRLKFPNRMTIEITDLHREYLLKKSPRHARFLH